MSKDFGVADSYRAIRIVGPLIAIHAEGTAPNLTTRVTIEQLPWRIFPPRFGLFFEEPQITLPARKPFAISRFFVYPEKANEVVVVDARGAHVVEIASAFAARAEDHEISAVTRYNVHQLLKGNRLPGVSECLIAPIDNLVPAIYHHAFGPASLADCEAWQKKHCDK